MTTMKLITFTPVFFLLSLLPGCAISGSPEPEPNRNAEQVNASSPASNCGAADNQQGATLVTAKNPIRIVVFQDKSGSALSMRTEQLVESDFLAPISLLRCAGGEIAFGLINDQSNRPLLRLRIEVPPMKPIEPAETNPLRRAELEVVYKDQLTAYDESLSRWEGQTSERINSFMDQLRPMLAQRANARTTSVWPAVARADLFLSERDVDWPKPTHRYAVFNSDAIDTARSTPVAMKSGAKLLLVNGVASVGVLGSLDPVRFESTQSAFRFIAATELGGGQQ